MNKKRFVIVKWNVRQRFVAIETSPIMRSSQRVYSLQRKKQ